MRVFEADHSYAICVTSLPSLERAGSVERRCHGQTVAAQKRCKRRRRSMERGRYEARAAGPFTLVGQTPCAVTSRYCGPVRIAGVITGHLVIITPSDI